MEQDTVDKHLDAVLKASGSALRHYSMQKTIDDMRAAMREAMGCNAHDDLVSALADCIEALDFVQNRTSCAYNPPTLDNAKTVLAKAKGEQ